MFYSYYLLTNRQPLEVAAKICHFNRYVHVRLSLIAELAPASGTGQSEADVANGVVC